MKKKTIYLSVFIAILILVGLIIFFIQRKNPSTSLQSNLTKEAKVIKPSETFIDYEDPAGFRFSYPDNLSISKAEIEDPNVYTDLEIYSKDVSGSVKLRIADTKIASLSAWLKDNGIPNSNTPKEMKLGNLNALEVKTNDRLLLGALDKGVLFTIEMPLVEENFWMKVYGKVLSEFTFIMPDINESSGKSNTAAEDVVFEGEEVVE